MEEKDNRFRSLGGVHTALLRKFCCFFMFSDDFFPIFFVATVGRSIELGAFDRIQSSIRFQAQRDDVARLINANLVLLVVS